MNKEIVLTPEELFFIGRLLQAKYIDYAYVAAMNDINKNFALFETECKAALVSSGILMEDFGGNIEVDLVALSVLKPIFFGEIETSIDICNIGKTNTVDVYKYHFHDSAVTEVTGEKGKFVIKTADPIVIRDKVESLISENYDVQSQVVDIIDKTHITRFIAFKQIHVGTTSMVKTYVESDGVFYQEKEEKIESITRAQFVSGAFDVVKGV